MKLLAPYIHTNSILFEAFALSLVYILNMTLYDALMTLACSDLKMT